MIYALNRELKYQYLGDGFIPITYNFGLSLPFLFNNPSSDLPAKILDEWNLIKNDIITTFSPNTHQLSMDRIKEHLSAISTKIEQLDSSSMLKEGKIALRSFIDPFFFIDEHHTYFVEPTLTDTTIQEWAGWIFLPPSQQIFLTNLAWMDYSFDMVPVHSNIPDPKVVSQYDTKDFIHPDPLASFKINSINDWITDDSTILFIDEIFIGRKGLMDMNVLLAGKEISNADSLIRINPDGDPVAESMVTANNRKHLDVSLVSLQSRGLNVVGSSGMNLLLSRKLGREQGMYLND